MLLGEMELLNSHPASWHTSHFCYTVLDIWQTLNIWLSRRGANLWFMLTNLCCPDITPNLAFFFCLSKAPVWCRPSVLEPVCNPAVFSSGVSRDLHFGWSGSRRNEGDGDVWADRRGGALQGRVDGAGAHPASHTEIQKAPGAGELWRDAPSFTVATGDPGKWPLPPNTCISMFEFVSDEIHRFDMLECWREGSSLCLAASFSQSENPGRKFRAGAFRCHLPQVRPRTWTKARKNVILVLPWPVWPLSF